MFDNGPVDRKFTVDNKNGVTTTIENMMNVQRLERCLTDRIDRRMGNVVDAVEGRIENAILTAIDNTITRGIEFAVRSINAFSEPNAASFTANSEHWEHTGGTASFEKVSDRNNTFHELNRMKRLEGTSLTR